eukprot:2660556-Rhodomonas_salina.2
MRERLDGWAAEYKDRFKLVYCVGTRWKDFIIGAKTDKVTAPLPPEGFEGLNNGITHGVHSWIDEKTVKEHAFPPAADTQVFVCGLPSVYESLCGPRTEKALAPMSVLARLGYTEDMVFKLSTQCLHWEAPRLEKVPPGSDDHHSYWMIRQPEQALPRLTGTRGCRPAPGARGRTVAP